MSLRSLTQIISALRHRERLKNQRRLGEHAAKFRQPRSAAAIIDTGIFHRNTASDDLKSSPKVTRNSMWYREVITFLRSDLEIGVTKALQDHPDALMPVLHTRPQTSGTDCCWPNNEPENHFEPGLI